MTEIIIFTAQITLLVAFTAIPVILIATAFAVVRLAWLEYRK